MAPGAADLGNPELRLAASREDWVSGCSAKPFPERVVSAALLADELLLEILPLERWAAVSYVVDWPSATPVHARFPAHLPRTGSGAEELLSQRPDLVVVSDYNSAAVVAQLVGAGICVRHLKTATNFEALLESFRQLGAWVGEPRRTEAAIAVARARLHRLQSARLTRSRRVLLLQGALGYAKGTLQDECLRLAGLENVLAAWDAHATPSLNTEQILALAPELIFVAANVSRASPGRLDQLPTGVPWQALAAVRSGHYFAVPEAWMASISPHALLACEAYVELARRLG